MQALLKQIYGQKDWPQTIGLDAPTLKTVLKSLLDLVSLGWANEAFRRSSDTNWCAASFTTSFPKLICGLSLKLTALQLWGKASTLVTLLEDRSNSCRTPPNGQDHGWPKPISYGISPVKVHSAALKIRNFLHPAKDPSSFSTVVFDEVPVMSRVVKAGNGQIDTTSELTKKFAKMPSRMRTSVHANFKVLRNMYQSLKWPLTLVPERSRCLIHFHRNMARSPETFVFDRYNSSNFVRFARPAISP